MTRFVGHPAAFTGGVLNARNPPGSYAPLIPTLAQVRVGAYLLETCTPRAGEIDVLKGLPDDARIGVGVVNQKHAGVEALSELAARIGRAIELFGRSRVLLHPDYGFATFADNPICSGSSAQDELVAISEAVRHFR